ncbi:gliding motility-associated C-terminal domain-containing protein [Pseudozobellia thermophila]|uniref:Gliding motility-associated C-terminal domain-containing protein n=1 Tax=Pseudozobellia thermophila TaxID=192903 RepID=A0A1M6LUF3_9FLAO|nr:gliding motility-associated C-terminal domain-containing protein [Pseudozobellia thermophila]SHJ74799.1 gliding motility-associated C-terminal domain-containing protein [Pseudozobellia thermophila]
MTDPSYMKPLLLLALPLCMLLFPASAAAQCSAGTDRSVIVCNKDSDEGYKTFDLFSELGGIPSTGGIWSTNDPANFFALDRNTGIVNLWEVKNSGLHEFKYTITCSGIEESATMTVILGGYPGEDNTDGSADACGDDPAVNLHGYIGDETEGKFQDFNGLWEAVTPEAAPFLTTNFFNAKDAGTGIYEFTHTTPAVGACPSRQVRLILEVQRPANSGFGSNLVVCTSDDLSGLTDFDLNDLLEEEDINGTWSEGPSTDQLDDLTDHTIDIQAIRDNNLSGTFTFTYTVYPQHAVCTIQRTSVDIVILPTLRGTMEASNFCEGPENYTVLITDYDDTLIGSGTYEGSYTLVSDSGTSGGTTSIVLNNDRTGSFSINASNVVLNENTILSITSLGAEVCPDIQVPPVSFIVTDPVASVADSCQDTDIPVSLSHIFDATLDQANGNYDVTYTLTAPNGDESSYTTTSVAFSSGNASFSIPGDQVGESGEYDIRFDIDSGFDLGCAIATSFVLVPPPSAIELNLLVDNSCNATQIDVMVDAPVLDDGDYDIIYDVVSQGTGQTVLENTISFTGGTASYDLDVSPLAPGNYTVSVRSSQNDTTPCRIEFEFEESENFAIEGIPSLPVAEAEQTLCLGAFPESGPTLADIDVSANGQVLFYATATDTDILALDTPLQHGEDYFISNTDPDNNCEGSDRIRVVITLSDPQAPTALDPAPSFCASEEPSLQNLDAYVDGNGNNILWFDAPTGGSALGNDTPLIDGKSYFAVAQGSDQCPSSARVEIVPTVYGLEPASLEFTSLALCGLDNPSILDLRAVESDNAFEVLWYDTPEEGAPLDDNTLLQNETTYYAVSFNPETGCMNTERMAVTVDLTNCDPEDYGFFVPDGFSPNGDGRNDTFFVPNIEVIFPNYTLEIINRYGATMFKGDRNDPAWNGSNGGQVAPNGVYFYIINYNKKGHAPVQGRLYLNR